jgi:hypothetical protein
MRRIAAAFIALVGLLATGTALAGAQKYEPLSAAVQARLQRSISDTGAPRLSFADPYEGEVWLATMSARLAKRMPDDATRTEFLTTVHYESTRADPRGTLEAIARHWAIALTPEALDAAVAAGTKEAMALKVDPEAEPNVLQNRQQSLQELFSGEAMDIYASRVRELFRYDLGYDFMTPPAV